MYRGKYHESDPDPRSDRGTADAGHRPSRSRAGAATVWECYVYNPVATQPSVEAMQRLIDHVKQQTNGELEINLHLGQPAIKADGITAAVSDGVVQLGDDGFATGTIPISAVIRLPMLLQSLIGPG